MVKAPILLPISKGTIELRLTKTTKINRTGTRTKTMKIEIRITRDKTILVITLSPNPNKTIQKRTLQYLKTTNKRKQQSRKESSSCKQYTAQKKNVSPTTILFPLNPPLFILNKSKKLIFI